MRMRVLILTLLTVALAGTQAMGQAKHAEVSLLASKKAVVPGTPIEVGLRFVLDEDWHIYWKNPGPSGTGQTPQVKWTLPEGFTASDFRYPIPRRYVSPGDIITYVHDGEPMLLATIDVPATYSGESVRLAAEVNFLICSKQCVRQRAEVSETLPVLAKGPAPDADEDILADFERARFALPQKSDKIVKVRAWREPGELSPGDKFAVIVEADILATYHIQSNKPTFESAIAANVFLDPPPDVYTEPAIYPKPKFRKVPYLGQLSEFEGKIRIRIPAEVDEEAEPGDYPIDGVFRYQACDAKGTCLPPTGLMFTVAQPASGTMTAQAPSAGDPSDAGSAPAQAGTEGGAFEAFLSGLGTPGMLALCFLYGLFINATPCVLPLLSIKVLGFIQQAHESRERTLLLGLSFGGGVLLFFIVLGLLAAQGTNLLHYPYAVVTLGAIVTALALSMLGVFTLQAPSAAAKLDASIQQEGLISSFGKGALAPVLGFACTAPMMLAAMAWAIQLSRPMAIVAFAVMGLGMAFPYVLLGAFPNLLGFLPKPGNWMITFERIVGFLLLGFVILLLQPISQEFGTKGLEVTFLFLLMVGFSCWLLGKVSMSQPESTRWGYRGGAAAATLLSGLFIFGLWFPLKEANKVDDSAVVTTSGREAEVAFRKWSAAAVREAVENGNTVFVDYTSASCTNCKVNKVRAINRQATVEKLKALNAVTFQADFTSGGKDIFEEFKKYGRAGPPLNLVYAPGNPTPEVLPILFTQDELLAALDRAGPSRPVSAARMAP